MRKNKIYIFLILLIGISLLGIAPTVVHATVGQWSLNGTAMYYGDGYIGIGTSNPHAGVTIYNQSSSPISELALDVGSFSTYQNAVNSYFLKATDLGGGTTDFIIRGDGNVGIGTPNPTQKLSVKGVILAQEILVSIASSNWPDYVFDKNYKLMPLNDLEKYIQNNKHLPGISSAEDIKNKDSVALGETQKKQMEKIEELTLHLIDMNKRIDRLEEQNKLLSEEVNLLKQNIK